jgi:asparagine synthase (glutamine-hydrolysing)
MWNFSNMERKDEQLKTTFTKECRIADQMSDIHITENGHIFKPNVCLLLIYIQQPIQGCDTAYMVHNDEEIYNHQNYVIQLLKERVFKSKIGFQLFIYMKNLNTTFTSFRWRFAFVVVDGDDFIAGRDPLGVNHYIMVLDERKNVFRIRNEPIADQCKTFSTFLRTLLYSETGFVKYYKPEYEDYKYCDKELDLSNSRFTYQQPKKTFNGDIANWSFTLAD